MSGIEASLASGLLKVAGDKLVNLIASEFSAITGVKKDLSELKNIHGEITSWLSVVCDLSIENAQKFRWVIELKGVAYEIDDLLYEVHLEAEKHEIDSNVDKHSIADWFYAKPKSYLFRCKVAQKIKAIKVKFASIAKGRRDINDIRYILPVDQLIPCTNMATGELSLLTNVEESQIPTRDREKAEVICMLLDSNEEKNGWIISIVGLAGSGKTTLAKHICNDSKIKEHFKGKIFWVHVSQEFDVIRLIRKLFEAITKQISHAQTLQYMVDEISKKITGEKFLLVLDDAWHEDKEDWKIFLVILRTRTAGSKLVITTRNQKVAEAVESGHIFDLAYLSDVESWSLFLKSSGRENEDLGSNFVHVGKEIVNKCGGVPLALKILGAILGEKSEISTWRAMRDNELWNEENAKGRVFASLKLSYIHLGSHLKQCFVFCSIFPKGYKINKNFLIEQWIVHGFIKLRMQDQPEIIGSEYFDSLVKLGFLQYSLETRHVSRLYEMHDLIHDLTRYILRSDMVTSVPMMMNKDCTQKCRYLSLTSCSKHVKGPLFDKIRALYVSSHNPSLDKIVKMSRFICSVVLDYAVVAPFPLFILKLEYLGYLEIRNVSCMELPEAISSCWNLRSLHLIGCGGFATLPKSIGKLKKLRTLVLAWTHLACLPQSIGECRDLQSLQILRSMKFREIPNTIGTNENLRLFQIVECCNFQQLPSELNGELSNLQTINLSDCWSLRDLPDTFPSCTLHTLNLSQTRVTKLPEWVTLISTLQCINLEYCRHLVELPRDIRKLKKLEFLNLNGCHKLCWMPSGFALLTSLKRLDMYVVGCGGDHGRISDLEKLNMISGHMEIKNLQHLIDSSDAEKACLKQKKNIHILTLTWDASTMDEEFISDLGVLDALEPPSEIKKLGIYGYRGALLPCWMSKQNDSSYLDNLVLRKTSQYRFLCLVELVLSKMPNLKHIREILVLPSLKTLRLVDMPNLEELWTTTSGLGTREEEVRDCFPLLSFVEISKCPKLIVEPYFPPSLESMNLVKSNNQLLNEPSSSSGVLVVPHLKNLKLDGMTGSASDWGFLQHLAGLESLEIQLCDGLMELPQGMRHLTSLQRLCIDRCSTYVALPEWLGELRSLQDMSVSSCPMMPCIPWSIEQLTSLRWLGIHGWRNLKQLPEAIQHLSSLQCLLLSECSSLTVLPEWIGQLSALQLLWIKGCPALQCLPSSIRRLTALKDLTIDDCPDLAKRYKKGVGDDWHLLSHIPYVGIYTMPDFSSNPWYALPPSACLGQGNSNV